MAIAQISVHKQTNKQPNKAHHWFRQTNYWSCNLLHYISNHSIVCKYIRNISINVSFQLMLCYAVLYTREEKKRKRLKSNESYCIQSYRNQFIPQLDFTVTFDCLSTFALRFLIVVRTPFQIRIFFVGFARKKSVFAVGICTKTIWFYPHEMPINKALRARIDCSRCVCTMFGLDLYCVTDFFGIELY